MRFLFLVLLSIAWVLLLNGCVKRERTVVSQPAPSLGGAGEVKRDSDLDKRVGTYLDAFKASDPNQRFYGEALLAQSGRVVAHRAYGGAIGRRFLVGSITKCMTAVAIMQLHLQGKLKIEDSVRKYLPELSENYASITVEQLLAHRGGLGNYTADEAIAKRGHLPHSTNALVRAIDSMELIAKPGEATAYSNSGYALLGVVIERVSGQSWSAYLQERVFVPAGMNDTSIERDDLVQGWVPAGQRWELAQSEHASFAYASGAVVSTAMDLFRFSRALHDGVLVPKDGFERMSNYDPDSASPSSVGLGFFRANTANGVGLVGHGGAMAGFRSSFWMTRDGSWTTVVLSNTQTAGVEKIATDLLTMALTGGRLKPAKAQDRAPFDPDLAKQLAGSYKLSRQEFERLRKTTPERVLNTLSSMEWRVDRGHRVKPVGQEAFDLYPLQNGHFGNDDLGVALDVELLFDGDVPKGFVVRQGAFEARYEKLRSTDLSP